MDAERRISGEPQEPILEPEQHLANDEPSSSVLKTAIVVLVLVAGIAIGYGWLQHNVAQELASERADLRTSLAQAKSQEDVLTAKVNALNLAQEQEEAARAQAEAEKQARVAKNEQFLPADSERPQHAVHHASARRAHADDPRWNQMAQQLGDQQKELADSQKQIADSQKQIAETQADLEQAKAELNGSLQSARTELGGDIARNHDELVRLEKKGERNFFEFSFEKSKAYHHAGPLSISLRKADGKHEYCDLELIVDDRLITKKHVNLYESISLYPQGYPLPVEVVINNIDKSSIKGYVSEPKNRAAEQAAAVANPPTSASVTPPAPAAAEVKLEHHDNETH
jgi:uncharacterized protein YlxW (UPF0749 family)